MQYVPHSLNEPKWLAKNVKRLCLEVCGIEMKHGNALEIVACMYGWSNWHAMHTTFARGIEPTRASCEEDVAARWVQYVNVLSAKLGIGENEAGEIVDRLRPNTLAIWTGDRDFDE